jgi:hypothetical protein
MVKLVTDTGARVTRLRTDKTNEYSVDGVVLKAFGSEPPTEVFEALGIDPYSVQSQMEPPFLLAASAGEVAQILNKAASIDDIDNTLGGLKRAAGRIARDINYNNEQLTKYTLQLEDYRYLDDLATLVESVEGLTDTSNQITSSCSNLSNIVNRIQRVTSILGASEHLDGASDIITSALELSTAYQLQRTQYIGCKQLIDALVAVRLELDETQDVAMANTVLQQAVVSQGAFRATATRRTKLAYHVDRLNICNDELEQVCTGLATLEDEYTSIAPDICPLCGHVMERGGVRHE